MGMASPSGHLLAVSLNLRDVPLGYQPPVGPAVQFLATYNQRESGQPSIFNFSNLGPRWSFNWLGYLYGNFDGGSVEYHTEEGGVLIYSKALPNSPFTHGPEPKTQTVLRQISKQRVELDYPDGTRKVFAREAGEETDPRHTTTGPRLLAASVSPTTGPASRLFLTELFDPTGNKLAITYDPSDRVVAITDAIGQITRVGYTNLAHPFLITRVQDPFGRSAHFSYDEQGRLTNITDVIGLNSQFTYETTNNAPAGAMLDPAFIRNLTTPYGNWTFSRDNGKTAERWLLLTDPQGETEKILYSQSTALGVPVGELPALVPKGMYAANNYLYARNTYYWDKKAYAEGPNVATKATIYHWLHSQDLTSAVGIIESFKRPLESRIWFNYPGQPATYYGTLSMGNSSRPTRVGRVLDDGTTQLYQFGYNALGRITHSTDPVGRQTTFRYASNLVDLLEIRQSVGNTNELLSSVIYSTNHLPVVIRDAAGQSTTNTFNSRGQLLATQNPRGEITTFRYATNAYLLAIDGPLPGTNDTIRLAYDTFGRVRTATDVDGYLLTYGYDLFNRVTNVTYPDGTFAAFTFDRLDRVLSRDRQGRESRFEYNAIRQLVQSVDPALRTNRFDYCDCGSLTALTDAMGRMTRWHYDVQGRVTAKEYVDGSKIQYTYESSTSRLKSICDEKGQFKMFEYNVDNTLRRKSYPNAQIATAAVLFTYDPAYKRVKTMEDGIGLTTYDYHPSGAVGALQTAAVDGPWENDTVTYAYDILGRVLTRAIDGLPQTVAYDTAGRVTNVVNVLGSFAYTYEGATARPLDVLYPNGQRSEYRYFNNLGDRRLQKIHHFQPNGQTLARFDYTYEPAGNIATWQQQLLNEVPRVWTIGYDAADQLSSVNVTRDGNTVEKWGWGYDPAGNRLFEERGETRREFQYNALNELMTSAETNSVDSAFEWDAEHRLTAIQRGTNRTEFAFDGLGRRVRIAEFAGMTQISGKDLLWCGLELCEERPTGDLSFRHYFSQGEQTLEGNFYEVADHLQSRVGISDPTGSMLGTYRYDPFGAKVETVGIFSGKRGFTSHFSDGGSGQVLAPLRVYDPTTARWNSRDPLQETEGQNLYSYVRNNPIKLTDRTGLAGERSNPVDTWIIETLSPLPIIDGPNASISMYEVARDGAILGIVRYAVPTIIAGAISGVGVVPLIVMVSPIIIPAATIGAGVAIVGTGLFYATASTASYFIEAGQPQSPYTQPPGSSGSLASSGTSDGTGTSNCKNPLYRSPLQDILDGPFWNPTSPNGNHIGSPGLRPGPLTAPPAGGPLFIPF
ncbi:MAG: RHS repeat-associated core domain-containing protein [Verrucomicrobiales bacterium]|nr:RHS repeat-associated core domain-containing protein [Verrucomicrobiales bacterium]